MPVLDTNFLIALEMGDEAAHRFNEVHGHSLLLPSVVAAEFLTPFGSKASQQFDLLMRSYRILDTSPEWILAAAAVRKKLVEARKRIRLADAWIAAWAVVHDTYVVTRNVKDFQALGVEAVAW